MKNLEMTALLSLLKRLDMIALLSILKNLDMTTLLYILTLSSNSKCLLVYQKKPQRSMCGSNRRGDLLPGHSAIQSILLEPGSPQNRYRSARPTTCMVRTCLFCSSTCVSITKDTDLQGPPATRCFITYFVHLFGSGFHEVFVWQS